MDRIFSSTQGISNLQVFVTLNKTEWEAMDVTIPETLNMSHLCNSYEVIVLISFCLNFFK